MNQNIHFTALIVLLVTMSGCLSSEPTDPLSEDRHPPKTPTSEKAKPTQTTGSITGEVINDGFHPVVDSHVELRNATGPQYSTTSDTSGRYTINHIQPGQYTLRIFADCCMDHIQTIQVESGTTHTVSAILKIWASSFNPFMTEYQWEGFIACSLNFGTIDPCVFDPNDERQHDFEIGKGLETLVGAMVWEDGFNLRDCLGLNVRLISSDHGGWGDLYNSDQCPGQPLEIRLEAGRLPETLDFDLINESATLRYNVVRPNYSIQETNPIYQQRFTIYWQEWYWEQAPSAATALPDR